MDAPPATRTTVRARVLGCPVDIVDMATAVQTLVEIVERRRAGETAHPAVVVTLNPEMVMMARRSQPFSSVLESAALVVPDGIGLVRALRRRGHPEVERIGGADLIGAYLPMAERHAHRIALVGGAPGVAGAARDRMVAMHPRLQVVAVSDGPPGKTTAQEVEQSRPEMVLAAFGAGRQELFLDRYLVPIGAASGIGVGGTLDFLAGRVRRAPAAVRRIGLEWAWRLAIQPWRLRRQSVLPVFWWLERREAAALRAAR
ncbi:MAG: WecB/TagA/CpsF family glycosyltransferase [Candidatus Dormibacteria bacterium]